MPPLVPGWTPQQASPADAVKADALTACPWVTGAPRQADMHAAGM